MGPDLQANPCSNAVNTYINARMTPAIIRIHYLSFYVVLDVHIHQVNAPSVRHLSSLNAGAVAASILQTDTRQSTLPHQLQHCLELHLKRDI